jgi:hypothetical protein
LPTELAARKMTRLEFDQLRNSTRTHPRRKICSGKRYSLASRRAPEFDTANSRRVRVESPTIDSLARSQGQL